MAAPSLVYFVTYRKKHFHVEKCLEARGSLACASREWSLMAEGMEQFCEPKNITLGGGSLGSCVDEERSQLRELM